MILRTMNIKKKHENNNEFKKIIYVKKDVLKERLEHRGRNNTEWCSLYDECVLKRDA